MSSIDAQQSLALTLTQPSPEALWKLRNDLLAAGMSVSAPEIEILNEFHGFLNDLVARSTAREYSHFASLLDIAAVGGVALQNLLDTEEDSDDWLVRILLAAMSEVLMVMAARQYVKAWEAEMVATRNAAAWTLGEAFWRLSAELQPDLSQDVRNQLVEHLLSPLNDPDCNGTVKAALIVRCYQLLLVIRLKMGAS